MASKTDVLQALELRREEKHDEILGEINRIQMQLNEKKRLQSLEMKSYCRDHNVKIGDDGILYVRIGDIAFFSDYFITTEAMLVSEIEKLEAEKALIDSDHRRLRKEVLLHGVSDELLRIIKEF